MVLDLAIVNATIVTEAGMMHGSVGVHQGKTVALGRDGFMLEAARSIDAQGLLLLPGGVDPHVHLREPSQPIRETFYSGTMAAAAGGVTTICEHPISTPPQYSPSILHNRMSVASGQAVIDYAFFGAAGAKRLDQIPLMAHEDIVAFKTFFHGAPEGRQAEFDGLTMQGDAEILHGFTAVAATGKILAVHAENDSIITDLINRFRSEGKVGPVYHALSRPPVSEIEAVAKVIQFAEATGARVQLCHISTARACELVKQAKRSGLELYLETCPQYLYLTEKDLLKHGPYAKCNPPVRSKEEVDALWEYVKDGTVDFVGSDHGPYLPSEKDRGHQDIFAAPAGFPGLETRLPLMLTAVKQGRISLLRAVDLLSGAPAKIYGLYPQKGAIAIGADADLVLVDMEHETVLDRRRMYSMSRESARVYDGWQVFGKPLLTVSRGRVVMEEGVVDGEAAGWGRLVVPHSEPTPISWTPETR